MVKHFVSLEESNTAQVKRILELAYQLRAERRAGKAHPPILAGKTLAMIFEKPSLRTRVSFEQAMNELGGRAIVLSDGEVGLGKRESVADVTRVLNGMVHGIMARVFEQAKLTEMARHATVPVVNGLSDEQHPCQALADVMTIIDEFGQDIAGRKIAFIGDGNNVARSLATISGLTGMHFTLACPKGYSLDEKYVAFARRTWPKSRFEVVADPKEGVRGADVVVTDTWVSMGQEADASARRQSFAGYIVDEALMKHAHKHAIVLHCLPAYRGYEISSEVIEGPASRVFVEAHNRLHAQKGLLAMLMG